jgi:hypothetical protein
VANTIYSKENNEGKIKKEEEENKEEIQFIRIEKPS